MEETSQVGSIPERGGVGSSPERFFPNNGDLRFRWFPSSLRHAPYRTRGGK